MKLPPALSWMHLFGREASFVCDASVPQWMRAFCTAHSPAEGRGSKTGAAVRVAADLCRCGHTDNDGFVGINSRVSNRELAAGGYQYVRRFAVLPDLQSARWFVPLDNPAVSCAGFSLYSPARFSARMKVLAAKIAAHSHLPIWYRDSIIIAQRQTPSIEQRIGEAFGTHSFRLALSSGAPEPAKNRKVSLAVIGLDGRSLGFGKLAGSTLSWQLMRDETAALKELASRHIGAPELVFAGDVDGAFVTLQRPVQGAPVSPKLTDSKLALLASLRSRRMQLAADSSMVASLPSRIAGQTELITAFHEVLPILSRMQVPSTIVHGDFAPWNLREHAGKTVAFDWEYAELDGLPLFDETHYRLQVGYLLDGWNLSRAVAELARLRDHNALSLAAEQVRALQVVYLIDNLARLFAEGYDQSENEMVGWYAELLRLLGCREKAQVPA